MRKIIIILLATLVCWSTNVHAQDSLGFPPYQRIKVNFQTHSLEPFYMPFDVPFRLYTVIADTLGFDSVQVECEEVKKGIWDGKETCTPLPLYKDCCGSQITHDKLIMKRDALSGDSLFADINIPFRPSKNYRFKFHVFKRVSDLENMALNKILNPIAYNGAVNIFADPTMQSFTLYSSLEDVTSGPVKRILTTMADSVLEFYNKKHITLNRSDVIDNIKSKWPNFIKKSYAVKLHNKLFVYELIQTSISNARFNYLGSAPTAIPNWRLFRLLAKICADSDQSKIYTITPTERSIVHNIISDADTLDLCIRAVKFDRDPDLWAMRAYTGAKVNYYRTQAIAFYDTCAVVVNLLKRLKEKGTFLHSLSAADKAVVGPQLDDFKTTFFHDITTIETDIDSLYSASVDIDSVAATNIAFNFKQEFNIDFQDNNLVETSADFVTRGAWFIIADVGVLYVNTYPTASFRPYAGVNFNFWAVNRQANYSLLRHPNYSFLENLGRSLSLTVGVTLLSTFSSKDRYTELFGSTGSLLAGLALRVSDGVRLSGGAMLVYKKNPNPISDSKTLYSLFYGALSLDLTLKKWLGGVAKLFN